MQHLLSSKRAEAAIISNINIQTALKMVFLEKTQCFPIPMIICKENEQHLSLMKVISKDGIGL